MTGIVPAIGTSSEQGRMAMAGDEERFDPAMFPNAVEIFGSKEEATNGSTAAPRALNRFRILN